MALGHISSRARITTIGENSNEAYYCSLYYAEARDSVLRDFDWAFARREESLAELSGVTVPTGWTYVYAYPADCLNARRIPKADDPLKGYDFEVRTNYDTATAATTSKMIVTNVEPASLVYTRNVTNTEVFDSGFIQALSWRLSFDLSMPITGATRRDLLQTYFAILSNAQTTAANEAGPAERQHNQDASWISGRA
jgi:hypothetical protein